MAGMLVFLCFAGAVMLVRSSWLGNSSAKHITASLFWPVKEDSYSDVIYSYYMISGETSSMRLDSAVTSFPTAPAPAPVVLRGAPEWWLRVNLHRGKVRRLCNSWSACVQYHEEPVTYHADYRLEIPVEQVSRVGSWFAWYMSSSVTVSLEPPCDVEMEEDRMPWRKSQARTSSSVSGCGLTSLATFSPYPSLKGSGTHSK